METAVSVNGVPIRLTAERWFHIVEHRDELAGRSEDVLATIEEPDWITTGYGGSLVAWKGFGRGRSLAVVYRELRADDGFVITAFLTRKPRKKTRIWP